MTSKDLKQKRNDNELPKATIKWGWRYHHMGIPTNIPRKGERYLSELGMYVSGFNASPYGIEWMRFDKNSPVHELIKTTPHIAFEVDDLDSAIKGKDLLGEISYPSKGVKVAMIIHNGAPFELLKFCKK